MLIEQLYIFISIAESEGNIIEMDIRDEALVIYDFVDDRGNDLLNGEIAEFNSISNFTDFFLEKKISRSLKRLFLALARNKIHLCKAKTGEKQKVALCEG